MRIDSERLNFYEPENGDVERMNSLGISKCSLIKCGGIGITETFHLVYFLIPPFQISNSAFLVSPAGMSGPNTHLNDLNDSKL